MRHKLLDASEKKTYALIFESGDEAIKLLKEFAEEHHLKASRFTAIGAFSEATLGYFDFNIKDYVKIPVNEQVEVLSFLGDVALYEDKPAVHVHTVLGKRDGATIGGHLMTATVHPTLEVILEEAPAYLQKKLDKESGLPLIYIESTKG